MFIVLEYPQGKVKSYWRRAGQEEGLAQEWREQAIWAHKSWTMEAAYLCVQLQQLTQSAWHCPQTLHGAS